MKNLLKNILHAAILIIFFCIPVYADFELVCPPDVTVNCREDYLHDLNVYGRAYTNYNGIINYIHDCGTVIELDDCGKGTIKRTWGAENPENWKWFTCTQVITISNLGSFSYRDVDWPPSLEISSCDPEADLKLLTAPYDAPEWERTVCAKPMLSYKDTRFKVNPACIKLLREWKILDWCQYDPINYPGRGIFTYTQVIKLIQTSDQIALNCKKDTIITNDKNCDSLYVQFDLAKFESACPIYHTISNTSSYSIEKNANATGYYPNGKYSFYYSAEYACGKEAKCEMNLEIRNGIKPTPYCLTGVIIGLMPVDTDQDGIVDNGMAEVWASDLDKGSWHKCPGQSLRFSFSSDTSNRARIFNCDDVGEQEVEIWVTDKDGNQDYCRTKINIQNSHANIPDCDPGLVGDHNSLRGQGMELQKNAENHDGNIPGIKQKFKQVPNPSLFSGTESIGTDPLQCTVRSVRPQSDQQTVEMELFIPKNGTYQFEFYSIEGKRLFYENKILNKQINLFSFEIPDASFVIYKINGAGMICVGKIVR
ncbi:MAG: hypothetical protein IPM92_05220 [Saprospiraceae bacterium]|nr:hypothetical protein [Saprospiraceae bacterium]